MEIVYLKEFAVLAKCLNYSEAAVELHISQSNLSRHIQAVEREIGGALFVRSSRRVALSELGALYLPYAERISAAYAEGEKEVLACLHKRHTGIPFGAVRHFQYFHVNDFLMGFQRENPDCRINVIEGTDVELDNLFHAKRFNLFATYFAAGQTANCGFLPIGEGRVAAFLRKSHPLAGRGTLTLEQLGGERLLLPSRNTRMSEMIRDAFAAAGVAPSVIYEGSLAGGLDYVRAGMGVALQPAEYPIPEGETALLRLDVVPAISYRYGLGYRTDAPLSGAERRFVDYVRRAVRNGADGNG